MEPLSGESYAIIRVESTKLNKAFSYEIYLDMDEEVEIGHFVALQQGLQSALAKMNKLIKDLRS